MTRIEWTAHHEAGHAVIGIHERVGIIVASVIPDDVQGTLGHVRHQPLPPSFEPGAGEYRPIRRVLEPRIIVAMAGVVAERRFDGRRHNWTGASRDLRDVVNLVGFCVGGPRQERRYTDFLWAVTEDNVQFFWPQIEAVAAELLVTPTLKRATIEKVMNHAVFGTDDRGMIGG